MAAAPGCSGNQEKNWGARLRARDLALIACAVLVLASSVFAAAPPLVLIQNAPGRFEIAATDPTLAHGVAAAAEEGWRLLAGPLGLPDHFSSPVFVRIVPVLESDRAPFEVTVEIGGIVSAQLRADEATMPVTRRALVQALLMRLAVASHGVHERLTVPLWLEDACVGWWRTRSSAAQLDALRQFSAREVPPALESLLSWRRGGPESPGYSAAAVWLFTFLQAEARQTGEWHSFILGLLNGEDPQVALAGNFPGRFSSADDRALWWQTGYHHVRRARTLPALEAADSREQLEALARFVFAGASEESDIVVPLAAVLARAGEPVVAAELTRRAAELGRLITSLHPFYRNAGLSLAEAFAARDARPARRDAACAAFEQDWRDAMELEAATRAALDRLEKVTTGGPKP